MNNNTKVICGTIAGIMIGGLTIAGANQAIQAIQNTHVKVSLNGQVQEFKDATTGEVQYPITYNDRTYLPLRNVANLVGLNVDYDASTDTALLYDDDHKVSPIKSGKYTLDDIYFDNENLLIDFGENYQDFTFKDWYHDNVREVPVRYVTFDHEYIKSKFALTHDESEYISLYGGFNTWGNGTSEEREKVEFIVYDKEGNSKTLQIDRPFKLRTGVNLKFTETIGMYVQTGDTITIACDTLNEIKRFGYCLLINDSDYEKVDRCEDEAVVINNVAYIPVPDFNQKDRCKIFVKVEDIYGNEYYISSMVYNIGI